MKRSDIMVLNFVKSFLKNHMKDRLKDIIVEETESYGFDMVLVDSEDNHIPVEVKTSRTQTLKCDGEWSEYFSTTGKGLFRNSNYSGEKHYAYCINADCKVDGKLERLHPNSKWYKMVKSPKSMLIYVAPDGLLIWNHQQIKKAFIGYTEMLCSHTTYFKDNTKSVEYKALLDFQHGTYVRYSPEERESFFKIFLP